MRFFVAALALAATPLLAQVQMKPDDVVATVNGEPITRGQLEHLYDSLSPRMKEQYARAGGMQTYLSNYIERRLLVQEAIKHDLDKRADVKDAIQDARDNVLFDRYVRDVIAPSVVTEGDLRAWYESHKQDYLKPEQTRARHIFVSPARGQVANTTGSDADREDAALAKITRIQAQLKSGDLSFADAARGYSEDPSAVDGGDLGWFSKGQMVPEFQAAVDKLKKGETSDIVRTQYGYHIIEVLDRQAGGIATFDEVKRDIQEQLFAERAADIMAEVAKVTRELRQQSNVSVSLPQ